MSRVREYVKGAIQQVYQFERPEELQREGIDVVIGGARFLDADTIAVSELLIHAKTFLVTTGAHPFLPPIAGLNDVPFLTYEQLFDNDQLPPTMIVVGGGPIGMEMAQAYQRLGSQVMVVAEKILPKEEPEARTVMQSVFEREGIRFVWGRAASTHKDGGRIVVRTGAEEVRGDSLLIASGRRPFVASLDLDKAGVHFTERGIPVDDHLRTNIKNIYAAGDVVGGYQFTHFAGWQAFQAVRNALLPGSTSGFTDLVPWVTFTDPEVAHVGLTEAQATEKHPDSISVYRWEMARTDRAVCENDTEGFIKLVTKKDGAILGATIVAGRAGEAITEFILAIKQGMTIADLPGAIHAYPTYSTAIQQMAADIAVDDRLSGASGKIILGLSKFVR
jgi:pyruvate/2-oxoglutarate dehydrogenase complex dihydrolipoamide dehydrogenase (E3) component